MTYSPIQGRLIHYSVRKVHDFLLETSLAWIHRWLTRGYISRNDIFIGIIQMTKNIVLTFVCNILTSRISEVYDEKLKFQVRRGSFAFDPSFWDTFFRTYSTVYFFGRNFYLSQISWKKSNHKASITLGNRGISCFKSISLVLNLFQEMPRFEILWNWVLILNLKPDTQFLMPSQIESPRLKIL